MDKINPDCIQVLNNIRSENELFELWEPQVDCFVRDGIFDEATMDSRRILFVLRDAHIVKEKAMPPYDLRDIVKSPEGEGRTWNNIARWTRVLLDAASYADVETMTPEMLSAQLKRIAAINLKKAAGGARAERIEEFASKHKDYIKRQIEIIDPDIIIACGTFANIKQDVYESRTRKTDKIPGTAYRAYYVDTSTKRVPVVEFYHPQYNKKNQKLAEDMLTIRRVVWEAL